MLSVFTRSNIFPSNFDFLILDINELKFFENGRLGFLLVLMGVFLMISYIRKLIPQLNE